MQRIAKSGLLAGILVFVAALTGCATNTSAVDNPASESAVTVDMNDEAAVAALCGTPAGDGTADVALAAFKELVASDDSGRRNDIFASWGVNPKDDKEVTATTDTLEARAAVPCTDVAADAERVGVEDHDGSVSNPPLVGETEDTIVIDTTTNPATPPLLGTDLLDINARYTAKTLTWAGLVERVGDQQWYIDGVNARAAKTGFTWDDVLKFASANRMEDGKVAGSNALAIQVFNRPDLDNDEGKALVRDEVRKYITPEVEAIIGLTVDDLGIQFINDGFFNTRNTGTASAPVMGDYFGRESMIRVSLMPLMFNEAGEVVGLDASRGAGVFIDCGNLHWVPRAVWTCTDASCTKPPETCPPGTTGTPPNCVTPPTCPPGTNGTPPNCLTPKGNRTPNNGWTPLQAGPLTDGKESQRQQESGETRGNVIDDQVPAGTQSGDTTPDLNPGSVTAPGANPGGDDRTDDVVDDTVTNQDDGGTNGDTCITDPDTGVSNCG